MSYKIGARNIKTAISVFFCIILSYFLRFNPFYATTAAIISMESSLITSFRAGRNRLTGTLLGALAGVGLGLINPGDILLTTAGVVLVIYICNILNLKKSVPIASIVFLSIMLNWSEGPIWNYSFARVTDTFIGIIISMVVNLLISPYDFEKSINDQIEDIKNHIDSIILKFVCNGKEYCNCQERKECLPLKETVVELHDKAAALEKEIDMYSSEAKIMKERAEGLSEIKSKLQTIKNIYAHLLVLDPIGGRRSIDTENIKKLSDLNFQIKEQYTEKQELDEVYNYHLSMILEKITEIV